MVSSTDVDFHRVSVALRYEPMRWSPQIAESCQRLSLTHGVPGDSILVAMACISKVAVEGARIIQRLHEDPDYAVHAILHINALRTLFDDVKATLTAEQLDNSQYNPLFGVITMLCSHLAYRDRSRLSLQHGSPHPRTRCIPAAFALARSRPGLQADRVFDRLSLRHEGHVG